MLKSLHTRHNVIFLSLLRDRREALGLRQADIAFKLGQTQAMVSRVETGERRLDVIELRAWLKALELDFLAFMKTLDTKLREPAAQDLRFGQTVRPGRSPPLKSSER
jgi:transcriptional regulator with XRE-family HTH domain